MSGTSKTADRLSDQETAEVTAARAAACARFAHVADEGEDSGVVDPDNPPMTDDQLARLRPATEVAPGLVAASLRRRGGRPRVALPKVAVSIRLDPDVLGALRSSGEGWQGRANDMLRRGLGLSGGRDAAATVRTAAAPGLQPTEEAVEATHRAVRYGRVYVAGGSVTCEVFDGATLRTETTRLESDPVRPGAGGNAAPDPDPRSRDEPRGVR